MKQLEETKSSGLALIPFLLFIVIYMGAGIILQMRGVDAQCIHGDIPQSKREAVMQKFREGKLRVFVATDVASRGIDVDDVDAVFNYDVPEENEYYIHRIGRTGRARRHGVAYTLLSDFPSRMRLDDIVRNTRSQITAAKLADDGSVTAE